MRQQWTIHDTDASGGDEGGEGTRLEGAASESSKYKNGSNGFQPSQDEFPPWADDGYNVGSSGKDRGQERIEVKIKPDTEEMNVTDFEANPEKIEAVP
jgi:hypothetical protein